MFFHFTQYFSIILKYNYTDKPINNDIIFTTIMFGPEPELKRTGPDCSICSSIVTISAIIMLTVGFRIFLGLLFRLH